MLCPLFVALQLLLLIVGLMRIYLSLPLLVLNRYPIEALFDIFIVVFHHFLKFLLFLLEQGFLGHLVIELFLLGHFPHSLPML
jgi:hypothetical protein